MVCQREGENLQFERFYNLPNLAVIISLAEIIYLICISKQAYVE